VVEKLETTENVWEPFGADLSDVLNSFTSVVYQDAIYVFGKLLCHYKKL